MQWKSKPAIPEVCKANGESLPPKCNNDLKELSTPASLISDQFSPPQVCSSFELGPLPSDVRHKTDLPIKLKQDRLLLQSYNRQKETENKKLLHHHRSQESNHYYPLYLKFKTGNNSFKVEPSHNSALLAKEKLTIRNSPCYLKEKRTQINGVRLHDDVNFQQLLKRTKIQIDHTDSCSQVPIHKMQQSYENKACMPHSEECKPGYASSLLEVAPYHILCHKKSKMNKCQLGKIHKTEYALLFQQTKPLSLHTSLTHNRKKCVENSESLKTRNKLQDHNYGSLHFKTTVNTKSTTLTYTCEDNSIVCKSFSNSNPLASNYVPLANGNAMNKSHQRACSSDSSKLNAHQVTIYPHIQTNNKESVFVHYSSGIISIKPGQEVNNQSNNNLENLETGNPIQDKVSNNLYHNCSTYNTYGSLQTFPIDQYLVDVTDLPQFTNISTDTDDNYADMLKITATIPPNVLDYDWYPATSVTTQVRATKATEKIAFRTSVSNQPGVGNAETLSVLPGVGNTETLSMLPGVGKAETLSVLPGVGNAETLSVLPGVGNTETLSVLPGVGNTETLSMLPGVGKAETLSVLPGVGNAETLSVLPGAENFAFSQSMSRQQTEKLVVRMSGQANVSVDLNEPITHLGALVPWVKIDPETVMTRELLQCEHMPQGQDSSQEVNSINSHVDLQISAGLNSSLNPFLQDEQIGLEVVCSSTFLTPPPSVETFIYPSKTSTPAPNEIGFMTTELEETTASRYSWSNQYQAMKVKDSVGCDRMTTQDYPGAKNSILSSHNDCESPHTCQDQQQQFLNCYSSMTTCSSSSMEYNDVMYYPFSDLLQLHPSIILNNHQSSVQCADSHYNSHQQKQTMTEGPEFQIQSYSRRQQNQTESKNSASVAQIQSEQITSSFLQQHQIVTSTKSTCKHKSSNTETRDKCKTINSKVQCKRDGYKDSIGDKRLPHNKPLNQKAVSIMLKWYCENKDSPFPSKEEKERMAQEGCLTIKQVKSWFANKRNRSNNTRPKIKKRFIEETLMQICSHLTREKTGHVEGDNSFIIKELSQVIQTFDNQNQENTKDKKIPDND